MTGLLELKAKIVHFVEKNEAFLLPMLKFLFAVVTFSIINGKIGYMERLDNIFIVLILAVISSVVSVNVIVFFAGILVLLHLYALSLEVCIVAAMLFAGCFLLFFWLAPNTRFQSVLTPVFSVMNIQYLLPTADGLLSKPFSLVSTVCGTVIYYFLKGVSDNRTIFETKSEDGFTTKIIVAVNQLIGNQELYVAVLAVIVTGLVVYTLRRLSVENSWTIAIAAGNVLQFLIYTVGFYMLGETGRIPAMIVGMILSVIIAFAIQFFVFNLDYSRTERVQFEDDTYYYYVKAVPKAVVKVKEKKVTKISSPSTTKESLAEELNIDKELLK